MRTKITKPVSKKQVTLNRSRFGKISAVEGIEVPHAVSATFQGFDESGLSGDERRSIILKKYRNP